MAAAADYRTTAAVQGRDAAGASAPGLRTAARRLLRGVGRRSDAPSLPRFKRHLRQNFADYEHFVGSHKS